VINENLTMPTDSGNRPISRHDKIYAELHARVEKESAKLKEACRLRKLERREQALSKMGKGACTNTSMNRKRKKFKIFQREYVIFNDGLKLEEWAKIKNFDGYYASTHGRIRTEHNILNLLRGCDGQMLVTLVTNDGVHEYRVDGLVLRAFAGREVDYEPLHANGIMQDNRVNNLY
jgi:hypothetical protein